MPSIDALDKLLQRAVDSAGDAKVARLLTDLASETTKAADALTIIANAGMHPIPEECLRGEVFVASKGNLDLSSPDAIESSYRQVLSSLANKLRERVWKRVYLIPTGPPTLSLQIKLLVYHVTRLSSVDFFYVRGEYIEVDLDYRDYLDAASGP